MVLLLLLLLAVEHARFLQALALASNQRAQTNQIQFPPIAPASIQKDTHRAQRAVKSEKEKGKIFSSFTCVRAFYMALALNWSIGWSAPSTIFHDEMMMIWTTIVAYFRSHQVNADKLIALLSDFSLKHNQHQ